MMLELTKKIVGTHVNINDDYSVTVVNRISFKGETKEFKKEFPEGVVGIFHTKDEEEKANTTLNSMFSIIHFHEKLYDCGILVDKLEDF